MEAHPLSFFEPSKVSDKRATDGDSRSICLGLPNVLTEVSAKDELAVEWRQDNATEPDLVWEKLPPFPAFRRGMCPIAFEQVCQNYVVFCEQSDLRNASKIREKHRRNRISSLESVFVCPFTKIPETKQQSLARKSV